MVVDIDCDSSRSRGRGCVRRGNSEGAGLIQADVGAIKRETGHIGTGLRA